MELALEIALVIIGFAMIGLVVVQGRTAGLQSRDSSSIYRTKRGLEKTMHQATIALAAVFLVLSLLASLPLFAKPAAPAAAPAGIILPAGLR